ncbi:hypothetical protein [Piscinibacter koreensis]|uniref:Uncharacterized protein n=1 Tax=Piscinibacter koreensis TaxID=2742824 RepID=A0A7Y6NQW2_9BURK|nr:hypothetical protein [Schlegelella koreensis]NUZ07648.1 hypothetical protein [Schlegelella koreensis]
MNAADKLREQLMPIAQALGSEGRALSVAEGDGGVPVVDVTFGLTPFGAPRVMRFTSVSSLEAQLQRWNVLPRPGYGTKGAELVPVLRKVTWGRG